jgi:hypothetical protein
VREVVERITTHVPDTKVEFVDNRIMNQLSYKVRNAKLTAAGFAPRGRLADGIAATIHLIAGAGSMRERIA